MANVRPPILATAELDSRSRPNIISVNGLPLGNTAVPPAKPGTAERPGTPCGAE